MKYNVFVDNLFNLSTGDVEEDAIGKFQNQLGWVQSLRVHTWNFHSGSRQCKSQFI